MDRCGWATNERLIAYHDAEWGVPVHDDRKLYEFLVLDGAQAGLSWASPRDPADPLDAQKNPVGYQTFLRTATGAGYMSYYPESDVAQIYLATAGLLNLLVILDAISRAQTGLPTYHRELLPTSQAGGAE